MDLRSRSLRHNSAKKATTTQDLSTADDLKSDDEDYLSTEESTSSRSTTSPEDDTSILGQEEAAIVNIGSTPAGISPALTPALALARRYPYSLRDSKLRSNTTKANLYQDVIRLICPYHPAFPPLLTRQAMAVRADWPFVSTVAFTKSKTLASQLVSSTVC